MIILLKVIAATIALVGIVALIRVIHNQDDYTEYFESMNKKEN